MPFGLGLVIIFISDVRHTRQNVHSQPQYLSLFLPVLLLVSKGMVNISRQAQSTDISVFYSHRFGVTPRILGSDLNYLSRKIGIKICLLHGNLGGFSIILF